MEPSTLNLKIKIFSSTLGENPNLKKIGKGYLKNDTEVRKVDKTNFTKADQTRLVNNGLTYSFLEGR